MSSVRARLDADQWYCDRDRSELPLTMKGITIKLPEVTLRRLKDEARETGRSVAALVRERVEAVPGLDRRSVHSLAADLAGILAGSRKPATNERRRFRRA